MNRRITTPWDKIPSSEITPEHIYLSRRKFMREALFLAGGALALAACAPSASSPTTEPGQPTQPEPTAEPDTPNTFEQITNYNNYYEFSTDKEAVARLAAGFQNFPLAGQRGRLGQQTGCLRHRPDPQDSSPRKNAFTACAASKAGRWSSPGRASRSASCSTLVEPTSDAKYVKFTTLLRPQPDARPELGVLRLAVCRRAAPG